MLSLMKTHKELKPTGGKFYILNIDLHSYILHQAGYCKVDKKLYCSFVQGKEI
jgi:hypothetical protein